MNKYQKALDELKDTGSRGFGMLIELSGSYEDCVEYDNTLDILQEAVEKANKYEEKETPMALIEDDSEYDKYGECDFLCPNCKKILGSETYDECLDYKYCPKCGQRLEKRLENIKENKGQRLDLVL